jgi:hypothetical protein
LVIGQQQPSIHTSPPHLNISPSAIAISIPA